MYMYKVVYISIYIYNGALKGLGCCFLFCDCPAGKACLEWGCTSQA